MPLSTALTLVCAKLSAAAMGGLIMASGHAAAQNHDVQPVKVHAAAPAFHDHAFGPCRATQPSAN